MCWTLSILSSIIASFFVIIIIIQLLRLDFSSRPAVWAKLDAVGYSTQDHPILFVRDVARSVILARKLVNEGYRKFSKALDRPFALPTPWVRGSTVMVLPPSKIPLLKRPDKTKDGEWTNLPGLLETTQLAHVIDDPTIYQTVLHFDVVRREMSPRAMSRLAPVTADEMDLGFRDIWGTETDWKTINGWEACGRIISRASQRILIGLPQSRDETMLETSRLYANALLVGGAIINCFPTSIRWLVVPLVARRARHFQARYVKMLLPVVEERIRRRDANDGEDPDDFIQWMLPIAATHPGQLDANRVALRIASLLTPLIFAICYVFAHCVLDIHGSPDRVEVLAGLEEECRRVSAQHGGLATSESVDALKRVDSVLRESMRVSDVMVTNIFRDVTTGELDIGNGIRVGPGVRMAFPTQDIHLDPDNYPSPRRFDAFRFSRPFEGTEDSGGRVEGEQDFITTTTPSFMPFGYGRHACPGRWFAAQVMKQALAYLVLNYEVELIGPPIKRRALLNMMVPPVGAQIRIRRKCGV